MKKDIIQPEAENVSFVIAREKNTLGFDEWNAYLFNENEFALSNVIIASFGQGQIENELRKTSTLRHFVTTLEGRSIAKVETIQEELFVLDNIFKVTYFIDNVLYDINFTFKAHSFIEDNLLYISDIGKHGLIQP